MDAHMATRNALLRTTASPPAPSEALPFLLTDVAAAGFIGVSRASLWRLCARDPSFPAPRRLPGLRATRWLASDLAAWAKALPAAVQ